MRSLLLNWLYCRKPLLLQPSKPDMLRDVLVHASTRIPYYREKFVFNPFPKFGEDAIEQLRKFPILDKETIRERSHDLTFTANPIVDPYWNTSGGSTGIPIRILQDYNYLTCSRYITYSQKKTTGFRWGMPWIKIWGDEREIIQGKRGLKAPFIDKVKNLRTLNSFCMTDETKADILSTIEEVSPFLIVAYVQSIHEIAKFARMNRGFSGKVGAIVVSAGTLYPFVKQEIEQVFRAPIFNRYGSREVGNIAISSTNNSEMAISKGVWLEVVDNLGKPVPDGVEGEILVTSLINYAMPLIRYRVGDNGIMGCRIGDAGQPIKVLKQVTGRTVDLFKTSDGGQIDGEYFTHLMYFRKWIKRFQFVQKGFKHIVVKIELLAPPPTEDLLDIERKIKIVMGSSCRVDFKFPANIPDPSSGKFRFTISEL